MRKLFVVVFALVCGNLYGQNVQYVDSSLQFMGKGQLVNIYLYQVNKLSYNLPNAVWGLERKKADVPDSKYVNKKIKCVTTKAKSYVETTAEEMYEIAYYADKQMLINAILYLQKLNLDVSVNE